MATLSRIAVIVVETLLRCLSNVNFRGFRTAAKLEADSLQRAEAVSKLTAGDATENVVPLNGLLVDVGAQCRPHSGACGKFSSTALSQRRVLTQPRPRFPRTSGQTALLSPA